MLECTVSSVTINRFRKGDIVKHFKRELVTERDDPKMFLYEIVGLAFNTTTDKWAIMYKPLYSNPKSEIFTRDYDDFCAEVNHDFNPNIKQKYKFEVV